MLKQLSQRSFSLGTKNNMLLLSTLISRNSNVFNLHKEKGKHFCNIVVFKMTSNWHSLTTEFLAGISLKPAVQHSSLLYYLWDYRNSCEGESNLKFVPELSMPNLSARITAVERSFQTRQSGVMFENPYEMAMVSMGRLVF